MRILHVIPSYLPARRYGGPMVSVHGLCAALAARGHWVEVFTTDVDGRGRSAVPLETPVLMDGVSVRYHGVRFPERLYRSPALSRALGMRIAEFDVVHLHSVFLWPTTAAARAARAAGVPYVLSPRGMLVQELLRRKSGAAKRLWIRFFERANVEKAALIHATSRVEEAELRRFGFRFPEIAVIPNGIEPPSAESEPAFAPQVPREPFVLFLGRVNWKKGLDRLVAALALLPAARLVVAGNDDEGYGAAVRKLAEEAGVSGRLSFTGPAYGGDKTWLFRRAAVLAAPSYSENFGNTVLEAMAAGCPVVTTPEVGAAEIVGRAAAGAVVKGSPAELAAALAPFLDDTALRARAGAAGVRAAGAYGWPAVAERMEACYADILKRKERP